MEEGLHETIGADAWIDPEHRRVLRRHQSRAEAAPGSAWLCGALASALSIALLGRFGPSSPLDDSDAMAEAQSVTGHDVVDAREKSFGAGHMLAAAAVHTAGAMFWAYVYEQLVCRRQPPPDVAQLSVGAAGIATAAGLVDAAITAARLPAPLDHHRRKSRTAMGYVAFAAGLALGGIASSRR